MKRVFCLILLTIFMLSLPKTNIVSAYDNYSLTIIAGDKEYKYFYPDIKIKNGKRYLLDKQNKIDLIVKNSIVLSKNATIKATSPQNIVVTKEQKGKVVDGNFLSTQIDTALIRGFKKTTAVYKDIYPELDSAYINRCLNSKSTFTTYFFSSTPERKHNINLSAQKINGTVLYSGEEFSFNKVVGKRSVENGYKNAKVIQDGQFLLGVGGGVCQVSTSLYNAVLLAGLSITEYHPHSLAVSYVDKSFDAMVTDLWADFCFVNNTNGLLIIFASTKENSITFSIYGVEQKYTYKTRTEIIEELLPTDNVELVEGLLKGEQVLKVVGKSGYKSRGYLQKYYNGVLLQETLIRNDEYKKIDNLILQGK